MIHTKPLSGPAYAPPSATYGSVLLNNLYVGSSDRSLGSGYFYTASSGGFIPSGSLSDFTIEAWIYPMWFSYSNGYYDTVIMSTHTGSGNPGWEFKLQGPSASSWTSFTLRNERLLTDYQFPISLSGSSLNQWYHVAMVYTTSNHSLTGYLNGNSLTTLSISYFSENSSLHVGYNYSSYPYWFKGKVTNLRISKTARYTSDFTPSTGPNIADSDDTFLMNMPTSNAFQEETGLSISTYGASSVVSQDSGHP
jgi:hypothetical protein